MPGMSVNFVLVAYFALMIALVIFIINAIRRFVRAHEQQAAALSRCAAALEGLARKSDG